MTRWTEQQYAEHQARRTAPPPSAGSALAVLADVPARVRGMNKLEQSYSHHLDLLKAAGEIQWHAFEPMRLRLADGASFKPDFGVVMPDDKLQFHETKGHWREAARLRIKVAAELYPFFRFIAIKRDGGNWVREEFS